MAKAQKPLPYVRTTDALEWLEDQEGVVYPGFHLGVGEEPGVPGGPAIASIDPDSGPEAGGTVVTITGINLQGATSVKFGDADATDVTVVSATEITATSPAGTGAVDVVVTTDLGSGSFDAFTYIVVPTIESVVPDEGPTTGGTLVTITGTRFTDVYEAYFGGVAGSGFAVVSDTEITINTPARMAGTMDVELGHPAGNVFARDAFTFVEVAPPPPEITGISPATGPPAGGTVVTITGSNLGD